MEVFSGRVSHTAKARFLLRGKDTDIGTINAGHADHVASEVVYP
jgi:hypothetical protein